MHSATSNKTSFGKMFEIKKIIDIVLIKKAR